jgi:uncharacterized protein YhjY with autotransporter beta-barrel domain
MNTKTIQIKASRRVVFSKFLLPVLPLCIGLLPQQALAATSNVQFQQYITDICFQIVLPPPGVVWNITAMCQQTSTGFAGVGAIPSANLGTLNAGNTAASRKKQIRVPLDEQAEKTEKVARAEGGGWGWVVTPQYSKSDRAETDLENGYQSNLAGLNVGLDYRYSDRFVLGATIGQTQEKATFLNNAGSLKTNNNTFALYGTWLPSDKISVDGYLGYGKIDLNGQRHVSFGTVNGITSGSTSGNQTMAGMSTSYQADVGRFNLSPFLNLDFVKTSFKGYNETGTTTLEMHYGDRSTISFTSSLGARLGTSYGYDWGSLLPSAHLATVHEFQNNVQHISNELVITPGYGFQVTTDSPDRNYLLSGVGVSAALNGGTQLFFDFEKRSQDRLLSNWAVSLGALVEF